MMKFLAPFLGSILRHALSSVSGILIAAGISRAEADAFLLASEPVVAGLAMFVGSLLLSFAQKSKKK